MSASLKTPFWDKRLFTYALVAAVVKGWAPIRKAKVKKTEKA